jgi:hypothetical protein
MMKTKWPDTPKGAYLSDSGAYRFLLWRYWDAGPTLNYIGLNPSTADAMLDDQTIRKVRMYAEAWGYGGMVVTNLFAWRSTHPQTLHTIDFMELVGDDKTDEYLLEAADRCDVILCGWGRHGTLYNRDLFVFAKLNDKHRKKLKAVALNRDGTPKHPLYHRMVKRPFTYIGRASYECQ